MVNNKATKKGGGMFDFMTSKETKESCIANCDKKFATTPNTTAPSSAPSAPSKGMFSWFPTFGKKEEAKQPLMTNQQQPNQMGGKRKSKGSKKTRKNKKRKGTRKSSL